METKLKFPVRIKYPIIPTLQKIPGLEFPKKCFKIDIQRVRENVRNCILRLKGKRMQEEKRILEDEPMTRQEA